MKLSQIKKKYPKAWAEYQKKHNAISLYDGHLHNVEVREWYASIVDHFDKLGLALDSGMNVTDTDYLIFVHTFVNNSHAYEQVYGKAFEHFKTRTASETAGLTKLFEVREKQLKLKS